MHLKATVALLSCVFLLYARSPTLAQLVAARDAPVAMGHLHLYVPNIDTHKKFWIETLGGTPARFASSATDYVRFRNLIILITKRDEPSGTEGSVLNHVAFQVPDLRATLDRVRAAGYPIVTRRE